ncbi:MAG: virulence factor [Granulosicoccus sp.]|nr:virulence factor [Granulosicoccus sp.]
MAKLIKIYWRDIPSQVIAKAGRKSAKVLLPDAFQVAIDRAAMRAGKGTSDAYMEDWTRHQSDCEGDLETAAQTAAAELEAEFPTARLEALTKAQGVLADLPDEFK